MNRRAKQGSKLPKRLKTTSDLAKTAMPLQINFVGARCPEGKQSYDASKTVHSPEMKLFANYKYYPVCYLRVRDFIVRVSTH